MRRLTAAMLVLGTLWPGVVAAETDGALSDYPTAARADYVFGCMASNGQTSEMLHRCSCSIDVIASLLPYEEYVEAETILSISQVPGEKTAAVRDIPWTKRVIEDLRRAQAEAEIRCF